MFMAGFAYECFLSFFRSYLIRFTKVQSLTQLTCNGGRCTLITVILALVSPHIDTVACIRISLLVYRTVYRLRFEFLLI